MEFVLAVPSPVSDQRVETIFETKDELFNMTDSPKHLEGATKMKICTGKELVEIFKTTDNVLLFDLRSENERNSNAAFFRSGTTIHVPREVAESSAEKLVLTHFECVNINIVTVFYNSLDEPNMCRNIFKNISHFGDSATFDSKLKLSDRVRFRKRHEFDYVIVFDEESSSDQIMLAQSLSRKICESVIMAAKLQKCPLVLDGGFKNFRSAFPDYVSSSDKTLCPDSDREEDSEKKNALNLDCERLFRRNISPPKVLTEYEEAKVAEQRMNEYLEMWSFLGLDVPNRPSKSANRGSPYKSVPRTIGESAYKIQEAISDKIPPGPVTVEQMQSAIEAHEQGKNLFQSIINYKMPDKSKKADPPIDGDFQKKLREMLTHPWQDGGLNMPSRSSNNRMWQTTKAVDEKAHNEEEKFKKTKEFIATGLYNLGNTCYMNSSLQCLANNAILTTYFISDAYANDINLTNKFGSKGHLAQAYAYLLRKLSEREFSFRPTAFRAAFCKVVNYFDNLNQHDAAECVTVLLEALHEDLSRVKQKVDTTPPSSEGKSFVDLCKEYCAQLVKKDDSVIRDNFWGVEITVTTCATCANEVPVMLPISMLTLPLVNEATSCDLSHCLDRFFQAQKIVRTCSKCKTDQEMTEHHFLYKLPKFPILQLERFHREHLRSEIQKLTTKVEFSTDKPLNFDKYFLDKATKNCKFTLNAVVKHYGSLRSGHYVAVCRKNGRWIEFDDDDVRCVNETAVNGKEAYILFYGPQS